MDFRRFFKAISFFLQGGNGTVLQITTKVKPSVEMSSFFAGDPLGLANLSIMRLPCKKARTHLRDTRPRQRADSPTTRLEISL